MSKLNIIIPVYNCENTLIRTIKDLNNKLLTKINKILILDNNSTDKTIILLKNFLKKKKLLKKKIILKKNKENLGYGYSIKRGFNFFINDKNNFICILHADFQERPSVIINNYLSKIKEDATLNLILSSRFKTKSKTEKYSKIRKLGNYFFNAMTYFCSSYKMSDAGTAIILIHKNILKTIPYNSLSNYWYFHPQLNLLLFNLKEVKLAEIPLSWKDSEIKSTLPLLRYGLGLFIVLIKFWYKKNITKTALKNIF
jgi:glycosyltransferase involved in cell wall biosynthesis